MSSENTPDETSTENDAQSAGFLAGLDASTESESADDGFLSYAGEFHALAVGALGAALFVVTESPEIAAGLGAVVYGGGKLGSPHLRDARHEVAYTALGAGIGTAVGVVLRLLVAV